MLPRSSSRRLRRLIGAGCAGSLALLAQPGTAEAGAAVRPASAGAATEVPAARVARRHLVLHRAPVTTTTTTSTTTSSTLPATTTTVAPTTTTPAATTTTATGVLDDHDHPARRLGARLDDEHGPEPRPTRPGDGDQAEERRHGAGGLGAGGLAAGRPDHDDRRLGRVGHDHHPGGHRGGQRLLPDQSNGGVHNFGGAHFYGSKPSDRHLGTTVVGGAATPTASGYWLVTAQGNVYNYGHALDFGTPVHPATAAPSSGSRPRPTARGYWLVAANGAVFNYGDAAFCGSAVHSKAEREPWSGSSRRVDGDGYWLVTSRGERLQLRRRQVLRLRAHLLAASSAWAPPPTAAATGSSRANGCGPHYGDAGFFGSAVHRGPLTGDLLHRHPRRSRLLARHRQRQHLQLRRRAVLRLARPRPPKKPLTVVAVVETSSVPQLPTTRRSPTTSSATTSSNFQCTKTGSTTAKASLPPSAGLTVIEAAGWLDCADNSCLAAEAAWATGPRAPAAHAYDLYLFVNSPGTNSAAAALEATGPGGHLRLAPRPPTSRGAWPTTTATTGPPTALTYATSARATRSVWWLDVENDDLAPSDLLELRRRPVLVVLKRPQRRDDPGGDRRPPKGGVDRRDLLDERPVPADRRGLRPEGTAGADLDRRGRRGPTRPTPRTASPGPPAWRRGARGPPATPGPR